MGELYSGKGLRFGGFLAEEFVEATANMEDVRPEVREEIVAEAHYTTAWLDVFPEIIFLIVIVFQQSLIAACLAFMGAFMVELVRFYTLGSSPLIAKFCRIWTWLRIPVTVWIIYALWKHSISLSIATLIFSILQGWFVLIGPVVTLPIKLFAGYLLLRTHGQKNPHINNVEGMALTFAINRWRDKLE